MSSTKTHDPLPYQAVELVWARLSVRYGHQFLSRWDGLDLAVVKEDWRYTLAGVSLEQVKHGLEHLPAGRALEVGEFRKLCLEMPVAQDGPPKLPPPRGRMELRPEIRAAIARLLEAPKDGEEPYRVTLARRFVAQWDGKPHLSVRQQQDLAHFRRVIERFEASKPEALAAAKRAAQEAVDGYPETTP